jgi:steroid delta-isomerase-like uncharacterized protein
MSVEQNKAALQALLDAINTGNLDAFDDLVAADFQEHLNAIGAAQGREGYRGMMSAVRAAFPDLSLSHHTIVAEGDFLAYRVLGTGTHEGEFAGVPPTGKQVNFQLMEIMRFEDGKAVERWGEIDQLGILMQLGAIPTPG